MIDIGAKAKSLFLPSPLELEKYCFRKYCLNCYSKETAIKLLSKLLLHSIAEKE